MSTSTDINYTKIDNAIIYLKDIKNILQNKKLKNTRLPNVKKLEYPLIETGYFSVYNYYEKIGNDFFRNGNTPQTEYVTKQINDRSGINSYKIKYEMGLKNLSWDISVRVPSLTIEQNYRYDNELKRDKEEFNIMNGYINKIIEDCETYEKYFENYNKRIEQLISGINNEIIELKNIKNKYKNTDKKMSTKGEKSAVVTTTGVTAAELVKKIKRNIKKGNIKKANKYYDELIELKGKEWSKKRINKLIKKMGADVKISKGDIVVIYKKKNKDNIKDTDADLITNPKNIQVITPLVIETENELSDEERKELAFERFEELEKEKALIKTRKARIYNEYSDKILEIDSTSENSETEISKLKFELEQKLKEQDDLLENNISKIYEKYGDEPSDLTFPEIDAAGKGRPDLYDAIGEHQNAIEDLRNSANLYNQTLEQKINEINNYKNQNDSVAFEEPPINNENSNIINIENIVDNENKEIYHSTENSPIVQENEVVENVDNSSNTEVINIDDIEIQDEPEKIVIQNNNNEKEKENSSSLGGVIPAVLGVGAASAATVAGIRYAKNRKQNEEFYDDESEEVAYLDENSDDQYLAVEGSEYTDTSDYEEQDDKEENYEEEIENSYIDEDTEEDIEDDFENDIAYNSIV